MLASVKHTWAINLKVYWMNLLCWLVSSLCAWKLWCSPWYLSFRLCNIPGALFVGTIGAAVDVPIISFIALCKSPYMLFKGWNRLIQDLIGREGPFLETACVPFAGLAILLWPLAVAGAVLASILSSLPLGAYGAVVAYQVRDHTCLPSL